MDTHGNKLAREGCDRCFCGCKYWEHDRCIDCGTHVSQLPHICNDVDPVPVDQCPACRVEEEWLKNN